MFFIQFFRLWQMRQKKIQRLLSIKMNLQLLLVGAYQTMIYIGDFVEKINFSSEELSGRSELILQKFFSYKSKVFYRKSDINEDVFL